MLLRIESDLTKSLMAHLKRFFLSVLFLLFFCGLCGATPYHLWVSTVGNDLNPGTEEAPFLTLHRARDAIRELPQSVKRRRTIYVNIKNGTYRLGHPLSLTSEDSGDHGHPIVYRAAPGAHPVISGAIKVTGWSLHDASLGIYRAYVGPVKSRQLYVNSTRAQRAQTSPYPSGFLPNWLVGGIEFIPTTLNPGAWRDPASWTNPQDVEAVIVTQWKMMRVPIDFIIAYNNPFNGLIVLQEPAWTNANVYFDKKTNLPGNWSFWQVTRFENAYEFLVSPGQWYLDSVNGWVYYIPLPGENLDTAVVELPILETLVQGQGTEDQPIHHVSFEGLTFAYATWLGPSSNNGYVADQSGFILVGSDHSPNFIGHDPNVVPTPANLSFTFAHHIRFWGNIFEHLGGVGLQFNVGSQYNEIDSNLFTDISSSAIVLGGVSEQDHHPVSSKQITQYNRMTNNLIYEVGKEYVDAAAVFVGFTKKTKISHNTIVDVPWSAIAMGWGWGLLDKGSFPGLPNAYSGIWGTVNTLTPNYKCRIQGNRFHSFLNVLWDGGAIYTTGRQGPSLSKGLMIKKNVASSKRESAGGNTFYTDGGSRFITLKENISYDNTIGVTDFGPPPKQGDPLPYSFLPSLGDGLPYGSDFGGCVTYGDIYYKKNYWLQAPMPENIILNDLLLEALLGFSVYSKEGFFNICPFTLNGKSYPRRLRYKKNKSFTVVDELPQKILQRAGVKRRPETIPEEKWILPSF